MKFTYIGLTIISIALFIGACRNKKTTAENNLNKDVPVVGSANDTTEIKTTILSFYDWYVSNWEKLGQFKLYQGEQPPFKMDWNEVNRQHQFFRDSVPQLGEEFINNQVRFLKESDSAFKVDLQDEIPFGFDYDWYTNSQEDPVYTRDALKKSTNWNYRITGDRAFVDVKGKWFDDNKEIESALMKFEMKKESGKWKIAKIGSE